VRLTEKAVALALVGPWLACTAGWAWWIGWHAMTGGLR
jgi:hypothetical protein